MKNYRYLPPLFAVAALTITAGCSQSPAAPDADNASPASDAPVAAPEGLPPGLEANKDFTLTAPAFLVSKENYLTNGGREYAENDLAAGTRMFVYSVNADGRTAYVWLTSGEYAGKAGVLTFAKPDNQEMGISQSPPPMN